MICFSSVRKYRFVVVLFGFSLLVWQPLVAQERNNSEMSFDSVEPYSDPDAYQIYAALLSQEKQSVYVIREELNWYPGTKTEDLGIKGGRKFMRDWKEVMEDSAREHRKQRVLTHALEIDAPYELFTEAQEAEIFNSKSPHAKWESFYQRFPASKGYFWFSAVGFNPHWDRAIVYMGYDCGVLCAGDRPYFLQKKGGSWHQVSVHASVIVGAS
jgi:hypothetical protein